MATIDNANYEIYIEYTGDEEQVEQFKKDVLKTSYFEFNSILPIPEEVASHPMIEHGVYCALLRMALERDPKIKYLGTPGLKMSKDHFYKMYLKPFAATGILYESYTKEDFIKMMLKKKGPLEECDTFESAVDALAKKADGHEEEAAETLERMRRYGCGTRYSWRMKNWGAPTPATGCQVRNHVPGSDAILIYTSGGNAHPLLEFMAKKYAKMRFEIIWKRIEDSKAGDGDKVKGERLIWECGELKETTQYLYKTKMPGITGDDLDDLMSNKKETFRPGWTGE